MDEIGGAKNDFDHGRIKISATLGKPACVDSLCSINDAKTAPFSEFRINQQEKNSFAHVKSILATVLSKKLENLDGMFKIKDESKQRIYILVLDIGVS